MIFFNSKYDLTWVCSVNISNNVGQNIAPSFPRKFEEKVTFLWSIYNFQNHYNKTKLGGCESEEVVKGRLHLL